MEKKNATANFLGRDSVLSPSAFLRLCQRGSEAELMLCFSHWAHRSPAFGQIQPHLCRCCFHVWVSEDGTNDSTKCPQWWQLCCAERRRLPGSTLRSADTSQDFGNIYREAPEVWHFFFFFELSCQRREVEVGPTLCTFWWCRVVAHKAFWTR